MWLAFICILLTLYSLWQEVCFNYLTMLWCNQVTLSRQRWILSSSALQTPWCKLQGIAHGHIPLPKTQYQQAFRCQRQPMVRQSHPIIKRTCSKIHDYSCPLTHHKEFRVRWDWGTEMQQKCHKKTKLNYICVFLFLTVSLVVKMFLQYWFN